MKPEILTARIRFPYDKPPISANDREHFMSRARSVKQARNDAYTLARLRRLPKGAEHVTVQLHYTPKDRRRRDTDNLYPLLKAICDGLAAGTKKHPGYGLVADDTPQFMAKPEPIIDAPEREVSGGRIYIDLTIRHTPKPRRKTGPPPAVRKLPPEWRRKGIL